MPLSNHAVSAPSPSFSASQIRRVARQFGPRGQVVTAYLRQGLLETRLRWRGRGYFRSNQNARAVEGYALLRPDEFQIINAVQVWANWRTIPRNLSGRLPARPMRVLDLCSGAGDSTQVLACYTPAGSTITGLEIDARFVEVARSRQYVTLANEPQEVTFAVQDVLKPFCDAAGQAITDGSVDLINVSGAVAVHFDRPSTAALAAQCRRVIRPDGLALIDAGFEGATPRVVRDCFVQAGFTLVHQARSCILDMSRQLCFIAPASPPDGGDADDGGSGLVDAS